MTDIKTAKELLHLQAWLVLASKITEGGKAAYFEDGLLQEAGDSLMMKLGEATGRLARSRLLAPDGVDWTLAIDSAARARRSERP